MQDDLYPSLPHFNVSLTTRSARLAVALIVFSSLLLRHRSCFSARPLLAYSLVTEKYRWVVFVSPSLYPNRASTSRCFLFFRFSGALLPSFSDRWGGAPSLGQEEWSLPSGRRVIRILVVQHLFILFFYRLLSLAGSKGYVACLSLFPGHSIGITFFPGSLLTPRLRS